MTSHQMLCRPISGFIGAEVRRKRQHAAHSRVAELDVHAAAVSWWKRGDASSVRYRWYALCTWTSRLPRGGKVGKEGACSCAVGLRM